ncbi:PREDICTED: salivary acidic proline-rich phosphoprotein 1/2-like [Trachymyrmex septentrionalis]|uniref:salivary acidic proline-rich phosphoprotein 1/2-like n=1 Tax=Trachymyrmex septentrionalis TaxID=34720 RepID=UPI00084F121C|nr:PREDICTED: salivary acidic proline-rich phosphoprotein 1/2-like [Trachymyrmex septentrionalis]
MIKLFLITLLCVAMFADSQEDQMNDMGTGLRKVRADMAEHAMGQGSSLLMQRVAQNGPQGGRPPQGGPPQGGPPPGRGSGNGQQGGLIQGGGLQGGPPNRPPSGNGGPQGGLIQGGGLQGEGRD